MAGGGGNVWADQLGQLLGLDRETVGSQVLPFLDSFDEPTALRSHLEGLLGIDDPRSKSFIASFTSSRFPAPNSAPPPAATQNTSSVASATGPSKGTKGKKSLGARAGIGKPLPPRQIEDHGKKMEELSAAFGGMGTVYMKKRDDDLEMFGGRGRGKGQGSKGASPAATPSLPTASSSKASTPDPESLSASLQQAARQARSPAPTPAPTVAKPSNVVEEPGPTPAPTQRSSRPSESHPPTAEMLAIDAVIQELTADGASPSSFGLIRGKTRYKTCFCQGRVHPLAPHVPICLSCGLVICSALYPSPLSPLSACPSCAASPLLSSSTRADLLAKLSAERDELVEQQRAQIDAMRREKRLNKEKKKEEQAMFPQLGDSSATTPSTVPAKFPAVGRHGGLTRAKNLAQDAQRTAKVLSLDMKTRKVMVSKAKPKAPKSTTTESGDANDTGVADQATEVLAEDDDPYTALDGSSLVLDPDDDGYAMHFPIAKATTALSTRDAGVAQGNGNGFVCWTNRSLIEAQRLDRELDATEEPSYARYMSAEERAALYPEEGPADDEGLEEDASTGSRGVPGSGSKAAEATRKAVPGAAAAGPNTNSKRRKKKGAPP